MKKKKTKMKNINSFIDDLMNNKIVDIVYFVVFKFRNSEYIDRRDKTILHLICNHGSLETLKKIIEIDNIDLEIETNAKWRPIHYVCSNCTKLKDEHQLKAIKLLIDKKVNLESEDGSTWRPIHHACSYFTHMKDIYRLKAVKLLTDNKINLEAENGDKHKPYDLINKLDVDKSNINDQKINYC